MKFGDRVRVVSLGSGRQMGTVVAIHDPSVAVVLDRGSKRITVRRADLRIVRKG